MAGRILLLDGGDFLPRSCGRDSAKAALIWTEMRQRGYDAVSLGEVELDNRRFVERMMRESPLPIVSTNIEHLVDGCWVPLGEKSLVVEVSGVRIGILSVLGDDLGRRAASEHGDSLRVLPAVEELDRAVAELAPKVETIVLLAHMDSQTLEQTASLVPGIDVVLGGHLPMDDTYPLKIGPSIVNRASAKGASLAVTRLIVSPEGEMLDFGGLNVRLDRSFREDPGVLARIAETIKPPKGVVVRPKSSGSPTVIGPKAPLPRNSPGR